MTLEEHHNWLKNATLHEVVRNAVFSSVMIGTGGVGWTIRARESFVKDVLDSVDWAFEVKAPEQQKTENLTFMDANEG